MKVERDTLPGHARLDCYRVTECPVEGADEGAEWYFRPRSLAGIGSYVWVWANDDLREFIVEEESAPDRQDWWRNLPLFSAAKYAREAAEERLVDA